MYGFYKLAAATPVVAVADVAGNVAQIVALTAEAATQDVAAVVFPELSVTGYTCGDMFLQAALHAAVHTGLARIVEATADHCMVTVVGAPLVDNDRLYNCAVVIQHGRIVGVVPKSFLPNYREYYEKRWFTPGSAIRGGRISVAGADVPFGADLIFSDNREFRFGVELCEDLWNVIPPSSHLAVAGADVLFNLSASNDLAAKAQYRRDLVLNQSARCVAAYVYASSGVGESTTDLVFGGHCMIAENGVMLAEGDRFQRDNRLITADIDCRKLTMLRLSETSYADNQPAAYRTVAIDLVPQPATLERRFDPHPFVPRNPDDRDVRLREIFNIQSAGLAKRLEHIQATTAVIGISGGLDSTLALLVTCEAFRITDRDVSQILAVTMPGFGTGDRTYASATALCRALNVTLREIAIDKACRLHLDDIGHDPGARDVTFENVQARERTQILMNLANKTGGIVIGTGDLSEIALGWSTYNGDHMSMYGVNCGVPKTLVRYLIEWIADASPSDLASVLRGVLDTPVSPELLPRAEGGGEAQETEAIIGPYELHDFFLYHLVRYGAEPEKIAYLAANAFAGRYTGDVIDTWLRVFMRRFVASQFKRSCMPDGPKVGTVSLSPRGDWRMPSDASQSSWIAGLS